MENRVYTYNKGKDYLGAINIIIIATANINIMTEKILVRVKDFFSQRSLERRNRISFPDDFRQDISEGDSNIPEGPLAVPKM